MLLTAYGVDCVMRDYVQASYNQNRIRWGDESLIDVLLIGRVHRRVKSPHRRIYTALIDSSPANQVFDNN